MKPFLFLALATTLGQLAAAPQDEGVSFHRDVRPILQASCQGCHQPAKAGGKLILTSHAGLLDARGSSGPAVVAGKPEESLLLEEIMPFDGDPPSMPRDAEPLSDEQIELVRRWIAAGARDDSPPAAVDPITMEQPPVYVRPPVLTAIDYSPDGTLLAVSGYHEVVLHRADGSELLARLVGLSERIEAVAFSPDGGSLAVVGGSPGRWGEIQIWSVATRKLRLARMVTFDCLYGASWSPDGALLAFGCGDSSVRALDTKSGDEVLFQGAHGDWVLDTVFSTDASHLVTVSRDRSMKLIRVAEQQFIDNITSITPGALKGGLIAVDRHPAKDELLVGGADGVPKIYKMYRTQKRKIGDDYNLIRAFEPMTGRIFAARYSRNGKRIVAASSHRGDGEVRVYDAEDGKLVWKHEARGGVYAVAFRPDGKQIAAGGFGGVVELLDAETGELLKGFVPVPVQKQTKALTP